MHEMMIIVDTDYNKRKKIKERKKKKKKEKRRRREAKVEALKKERTFVRDVYTGYESVT